MLRQKRKSYIEYFVISSDEEDSDCTETQAATLCSTPRKIPRPPNAFMLYANENRKKMAQMHPHESNKEISCLLGAQWKNLSPGQKDKYFLLAKAVDAEHKLKYPNYVYNPKEARIRKAMRERERSIGAAQIGTQRARRSPHWQKPPPLHMPASHTDHLMGGPSKELCSALRAEMEHGFLANNGGGYVYPAQQYQYSPRTDYGTYIQVSPNNSWVPNGYSIQGNSMAQQQFWNQYHVDSIRSQQNPGPSYLMNPQSQQTDYPHHVEHMSASMIPMVPTSKSNMHRNLDNAATVVDRYLNIPSTSTNNNSTTTSVDVTHQITEPIANTNNSSFTNLSASNSASSVANNLTVGNTNETAGDASATVVNEHVTDINNTNTANSVSDVIDSNVRDNSTINELNMNSGGGSGMPDVKVKPELNLSTNVVNTESGFGGMPLYEDDGLSNLNPQDLHKSMNAAHIPPTANERKNSNPLPDFNQAFGSTERGRFQSPPDPRIDPDKEYFEFFNSNYPVKTEQYNKWLESANSYTAFNNFNMSLN